MPDISIKNVTNITTLQSGDKIPVGRSGNNQPLVIQGSQILGIAANLAAHEADLDNPHEVTKTQVGLGNVDNTSDVNKPISSATQTALDTKANKASITGATKTKITYNNDGIITGGDDATTTDIAEGDNLYFTDARARTAAVENAINSGTTNKAPSEDAVFTALAGKQPSLGFTPENVANKATDFSTANNTLYPSVQAAKTYTDGKVADAINDGVTNIAPSQNAVFDALALKAPLASPTFTGVPTVPTASAGTNTTQVASTAYALAAAQTASSGTNTKTYYVATTGNDSNNGNTPQTAFLTLSAALTAAGNSGNQVCVMPGTYAGNYTVSNLNVDIVSANDTPGGICYFSGTITVSNTSSSVRFRGLTIDTIVHSGAGGFYMYNCNVNTSLSSTSTGYLETNDTNTQGVGTGVVSLTGAATKVIQGGKLGFLTVNNASCVISVTNMLNCAPITLTAGILGIGNSVVYSATGTSNAISATGGTILVNNVTCLTPTATPARVSFGASSVYGIREMFFDKANSTLSETNSPQALITDILDGKIAFNASSLTSGTVADWSAANSSLLFPKGTTAQRPTAVGGMIRYNTSTNQFEGASGSSPTWGAIGGSTTPINNNIYYVSTNGNNSNDGLSLNTPFADLSTAATAAGNSACQIVVLPGTYSLGAGLTLSNQALEISAADGGQNSVFLTGTLTVAHATGTMNIIGISIATLVQNNQGTLNLNNCTVTTSLTASSIGIMNVVNSDTSAASISISGGGNPKSFYGGEIGVITGGSSSSIVINIKNAITCGNITLAGGILNAFNSSVNAPGNGSNAINATGGSVFLKDVFLFYPNGNPARLNISSGVNYSFMNVSHDSTNSTIAGTRVSKTSFFDKIDAQIASSSQTGLLDSTDWTTFNNKQAGNANLTAFAGMTPNQRTFPMGNGSAFVATDFATQFASTFNTVTASGDITGVTNPTGSNNIEATINNNAVTNTKLAQVSTATFKGRATSGSGNVEDLTATQATALLDVMVGDSGSGGTKGLVPAPASGDAAAGKFLNAAGSYSVPSGSFGPTITSPAQSDIIVYNGSSWVNTVIPERVIPVASMTGNVASSTAPTPVLANISISNYQFQCASDSGFSTIVRDSGFQAGSTYDFTPYVTSGNTYYTRCRVQYNLNSRTGQWSNTVSFTAISIYSAVGVWCQANLSGAATMNQDYPNTYAPSTCFYSQNGYLFTYAQRIALMNGLGASMGTQTLTNGSSYTFTVNDGLASAFNGGNPSYLQLDLGASYSCSKLYFSPINNSTPGGWGPDYCSGLILQYYNGSSWVDIVTLPTFSNSNLYTTTFSSVTARYFRLARTTPSGSGNYAAACRFQLGVA